MSYDIQDVVISAFDIHTTVKPLLPPGPDYYRGSFSLLRDPASYDQWLRSGNPMCADGVAFHKISRRKLENRFWGAYRGITHNDKSDYWALQLPMMCRPLRRLVRPNLRGADYKWSLVGEIYLSALGWSTHVRVRLQGKPVKNADIRDLVRRLAGGAPEPGATASPANDLPFLIGKEFKKLVQVFQYFQTLLLGAVYQPGQLPGKTNIPRHIVVGIAAFRGDQLSFGDMEAGDKAHLFGMLYGKSVGVDEVERYRDKVLFSKIRESNFAVTDFQHGTLVFPQSEAHNSNQVTGAHYTIANIRATLMAAWRLQNFFQSAWDSPAGSTAAVLRGHVLQTLQRLPIEYDAPFCGNLFLNDATLLRLLPPQVIEILKDRQRQT